MRDGRFFKLNSRVAAIVWGTFSMFNKDTPIIYAITADYLRVGWYHKECHDIWRTRADRIQRRQLS